MSLRISLEKVLVVASSFSRKPSAVIQGNGCYQNKESRFSILASGFGLTPSTKTPNIKRTANHKETTIRQQHTYNTHYAFLHLARSAAIIARPADANTAMSTQTDPCAGYYPPPTKSATDWLANIFALGAIIHAIAHYIGPDFKYANHLAYLARRPSVRLTCAVFKRIGLDCIRFVLAFLGLTVVLILESKKAIIYLYRLGWLKIVANFIPDHVAASEWISRHYDAAAHSHRANATRQRLRAARARLYALMRWGISVAVVLMILHGPPDYTESEPSSMIEAEARPYVVPSWVIAAWPENWPRDGSSSHYKPADERLVFDEDYFSRILSSEVPDDMDDMNAQIEDLQVMLMSASAGTPNFKPRSVETSDIVFQDLEAQKAFWNAENQLVASQLIVDIQSFRDKSMESESAENYNMESQYADYLDSIQHTTSDSSESQSSDTQINEPKDPATQDPSESQSVQLQNAQIWASKPQLANAQLRENRNKEPSSMEPQRPEENQSITEPETATSESEETQSESPKPLDVHKPPPSSMYSSWGTTRSLSTEEEEETQTATASSEETQISTKPLIVRTTTTAEEESEPKPKPEQPNPTQSPTAEEKEKEDVSSSYNGAYRYCSACQQKHCCQFPS